MDKLTQDQQARAKALNPNHSYLVQAPAGSGKTELLTQRFLCLLSQVLKGPEEILAVTFTRKAAVEMRHRILQALIQAQNQEHSPEEKHAALTWKLAKAALKHCQVHEWDIIAHPNRLRILTIDALCTYLAVKMPIASSLGAPPHLTEYAQPLYQVAARAVLLTSDHGKFGAALETLLLHFDNRAETLEALLIQLLQKRDQWLPYIMQVRANVAPIAALEQSLAEIMEHALYQAYEYFSAQWGHTLKALLAQAWPNLAQEDEAFSTYLADLNLALPEPTITQLSQWKKLGFFLLTQAGEPRKGVTKALGFLSPSEMKDKAQKQQAKELKAQMQAILTALAQDPLGTQLWQNIVQLPEPQFSAQHQQVIEALLTLLPVLVAQLKVHFKEIDQLDFSEVTQSALQALGEELQPSDLALCLDYQIQHILIDEFQDTSVAHFKVFETLIAGWSPHDGRSLFLVGDPMQSIYRFRKAEVGLFLKVKQFGINQIPVTPLILYANFRSEPGVVNWINQVFARLFPTQDDMVNGAISYSPSISHLSASCNVPVTFSVATDASEQAQDLVDKVIQLKTQRPQARIAILVRARSHLTEILPRLRQLNLAYLAHEIEKLALRQEILDLLSLTQALLDLADHVAWLSVLRAPWCGLSLQELHALTGLAKANSCSLWQMLQQLSPAQWTVFSEHGATRLRYLISVFQYWLAQRRRIALSQWIRGVWLAIGGPACYGKDYPMAMAERYFAQLAQMSEGGDILDFAQFKQALAELRMESSAQSVDPKMSPNAVPIEVLTIHKAKGLEFDAVFIPSLEKKARHFDKELLLWTECPTLEGMALLLAPCKANDQRGDPLYQYVQRQLQLKAQLEAVRLLYVAITRAKTEVYLSAVLSTDEREQAWQAPPKNSFLQLLWPYVTPNAPTPQSSVAITAPNLGVIWKKLTDAWQPPAALQAHYAPENPVSPVTQNRPQRATYNKEKIIGILVHRILQQLGLEGFATWQRQALTAYIPSWQTALQRLGLRQVDQANAVAMVMQAIKNTLNSKYGAWLFSTSHQIAHSEWSLAYQLTPQHMAYYVIDRSFIDAKGIRWIVDYKVIELQNTQQLDHEIAHYRPQLQKYCRALQALESRPVKCGLYFPLTDTWWQLNPEGA